MLKRNIVRRLLFLFLFLLAASLAMTHADVWQRLVYPFHYREIIMEESQKNDLDPLLVAAVIRTESGFKKDAESAKGAKGLMQVMPDTALWVVEKKGWEKFSEEDLFEPGVNIAIGTWYLGDLMKTFNGNRHSALAAYNGGRSRVNGWLQEGIWDGSFEGLSDIPYPETRSFINKVELAYDRYGHLYDRENQFGIWEGR